MEVRRTVLSIVEGVVLSPIGGILAVPFGMVISIPSVNFFLVGCIVAAPCFAILGYRIRQPLA